MDLLRPARWAFQVGEYAPPATPEGIEVLVSRDPVLVALHSPDGETIHVKRDRLETWLNRGYRRTRLDLKVAIDDLPAMAAAAVRAFATLVVEVRDDGVLDPHEEASFYAAQVAARDLAALMSALLQDIGEAFPIKEAPVE